MAASINSKNEVLELLKMPYDEFQPTVMRDAKEYYRDQCDNLLKVTAMIAFSNICRCNCLYCGMRALQKINRYRLSPDEIIMAARRAKAEGFRRIFLISGEDHGFGYENIRTVIKGIKDEGLHLTLACGEFSTDQFDEFAGMGVDEYVLKFEVGDEALFDRLNPSTSFKKRMEGIAAVKRSGMKLASGNIVGIPGQTLEMLAGDIMLIKDLGVSWVPVIPYMPVKGTPLAEEGGPGDVYLNAKVISILRLMLGKIDITAQQPGPDLTKGLNGEEGNLLALNAGANLLFVDFIDDAKAGDFSVVNNRSALRLSHVRKMAEFSGMTLSFEP